MAWSSGRPATGLAWRQAGANPLSRVAAAPAGSGVRTTPAWLIKAGFFRRHYANVVNAPSAKACLVSKATACGEPRIGASGDHIKAAVVLSRGPVITRDLTDFERAYFEYRDAVRLYNAAPFGTEFYFRKNSASERKFIVDYDKRMMRAFQVAASVNCDIEYSPPWRPPITPEVVTQLEKEDEEARRASQYVTEPRVTEADRLNDVKSLNRVLQNTLYLIVKKDRKDHQWAFPQGGVEHGETLTQAAERELVEECGDYMDTWFVGKVPMGHYAYAYPPGFTTKAKGAKVFFMKAHIFSGRVNLNTKEVVDHAWVTKEELQKYVEADYYNAVVDLLADR